MAEEVLYSVVDGVATITLNRPDRLNALNGAMYEGLIEAFDQTDRDDSVRAVVVTGAGRAFCSLAADLSGGARDIQLRPGRHRPRGAPRPRRHAGAADLPLAEAGHRGHQRPRRRGRGHHDPADGHPDHGRQRPGVGSVFRPARHAVPDGTSSWFLPRIVGISQALEWCLTEVPHFWSAQKRRGRPTAWSARSARSRTRPACWPPGWPARSPPAAALGVRGAHHVTCCGRCSAPTTRWWRTGSTPGPSTRPAAWPTRPRGSALSWRSANPRGPWHRAGTCRTGSPGGPNRRSLSEAGCSPGRLQQWPSAPPP